MSLRIRVRSSLAFVWCAALLMAGLAVAAGLDAILLKEFKTPDLELVDVSSDEKLLLMRERSRQRADESMLLHVVENGSWRTIDQLRTGRPVDSSYQFAYFVPGTEQVILRASIPPNRLAGRGQSGTFFWHPRTAKVERCMYDAPKTSVVSPPANDGRLLFGCGDISTFSTWYWKSGQLKPLPIRCGANTAVTPDATLVAFQEDHQTLRLLRTDSGSSVSIQPDQTRDIAAFGFTPDGTRIIVVLARTARDGSVRPATDVDPMLIIANGDGTVVSSTRMKLNEKSLMHFDSQLEVSADGKKIVVGYTRHERTTLFLLGGARTGATYDVYSLDPVRFEAAVRHPSLYWTGTGARIHSAVGGRTRLTVSGSRLFTTSVNTRVWSLR
jgi:hypothetical protein